MNVFYLFQKLNTRENELFGLMDFVKKNASQAAAWDNAWKKGGNAQWDIGAAHPALLSILKLVNDSGPLIPNGTAFVPGTNQQ